jgi:Ca-activated chloride channel homolog
MGQLKGGIMRQLLATLALGCFLLDAGIGLADQFDAADTGAIRTDANIVTGLDVSGSIDGNETQIQIEGMAIAMQAPEILSAIASGRHGQIGFAVFLWAENSVPVFVSWKLIGSRQDARETADDMVSRLQTILSSKPAQLGDLTDVSAAMEYADRMLRTAPFAGDRMIINIVGDGVDNVGEGPQRVRDALVARDVTIDGVVLGGDPTVLDYFRRHVIGGPTAFVLAVKDRERLVEVLARKFVTEIVLNIERTNQDHR